MQCAILVGLPGAGKTTFFRERLAATHAHVSKDLYPHARNRQARQDAELRRLFAEGRSVAVDNTNATRAERASIIAIARAFGATIVGYYIEASTRDAVARNEGREGRAKVPKVAIFACAKRLVPPRVEEGFDGIQRFRVGEAGFEPA